jgi:hypothetical protein
MTSAITPTPAFTPEPLTATLSEDEQTLSTKIASTWTAHSNSKANAKRTKTELAELRRDLAAHLHGMKSLLVRTGRSGCWSGFLREQHIPRVTADRYVGRHELVLHPEAENRPTGAISETELIQNLVRCVSPKVKRALNSAAAFQSFVRLLAAGLDFASETDVADGLLTQAE